MTATLPKTNVYAVLADEAEEPLKESTRAPSPREGRDGNPPSSARGSAQKHFGFDRRSGTGRGREVAKRGAGGKYTFGSVEDEVRNTLQGVQIEDASGADSGQVGADAEANHAGELKTADIGLLSLEEYQQRLERERAELSNKLVASKGPRRPGEENPSDAFRNSRRLDKDRAEADAVAGDDLLASVGVKEKKGRHASRAAGKSKRETAKENLAAEFFTSQPVGPRNRGQADGADDDAFHRPRRFDRAGDAGATRGRGGSGRGRGARRPVRGTGAEFPAGDITGAARNPRSQEVHRDATTRRPRGRGTAGEGRAAGGSFGRGQGRGAHPGRSTRSGGSLNTTDDRAFPSLGPSPNSRS
jgi:hypothetical protein